jgi:hypothetical protein
MALRPRNRPDRHSCREQQERREAHYPRLPEAPNPGTPSHLPARGGLRCAETPHDPTATLGDRETRHPSDSIGIGAYAGAQGRGSSAAVDIIRRCSGRITFIGCVEPTLRALFLLCCSLLDAEAAPAPVPLTPSPRQEPPDQPPRATRQRRRRRLRRALGRTHLAAPAHPRPAIRPPRRLRRRLRPARRRARAPRRAQGFRRSGERSISNS